MEKLKKRMSQRKEEKVHRGTGSLTLPFMSRWFNKTEPIKLIGGYYYFFDIYYIMFNRYFTSKFNFTGECENSATP